MHRFKGKLCITSGLVVSMWALASAERRDTHIVQPGESIQDAVDAASAGDTVIVKAGTYRESVRIETDGLTLRAQGYVKLEPPDYGHGCYLPGHAVAICVVPADFDPNTGSYTNRVRDVTISGFHIAGFQGDGVFGFGTANLTVSHVTATDNSAYGIASFEGVGTSFTRNAVTGSNDAGIYVGDSLTAGAIVSHNRSWGNALGILVRHARHVVVTENAAWGNCLGIFLLNDGQAGGSGDIAVLNNAVSGNDKVCAQFAEDEFLPILGGGGIVLAGSQHNAIFGNVVRDNDGNTLFSGGIVLVATPIANSAGAFDASTGNFIILNRSRGNDPADLVLDAASQANLIANNVCRTSIPDGLCGF